MEVPRYILDVFTDRYGLRRLVESYYFGPVSLKSAYDAAIKEIQLWIPDCENVMEFEGFRANYYRKDELDKEIVDIPKDVVDAVTSDEGFDELFWQFYAHHKNMEDAFHYMMTYIRRYVDYRRYKNVETCRRCMIRRRKKKFSV